MASSTRVLDLLASPIEIQEGEHDPEIVQVAKSDIEIKDLQFSYPNRNPVFSGLNLTIPAQKTSGLVGSTGSGKTTLTKLLLRFNEISDGEIFWSDAPIKEWKLEKLRKSIALVDQHITLFPTTIMENIRYGNPDADDSAVENAAKVAEAFDFIQELPEKWQTLVGEGGHRLSGGKDRE